jgi:hypothetical protein
VSAATRELGIERTDARRAIKIAALTPEAKQAALTLRLDNNRSALLGAARQPTKDEQICNLRNRAAKRASTTAQSKALKEDDGATRLLPDAHRSQLTRLMQSVLSTPEGPDNGDYGELIGELRFWADKLEKMGGAAGPRMHLLTALDEFRRAFIDRVSLPPDRRWDYEEAKASLASMGDVSARDRTRRALSILGSVDPQLIWDELGLDRMLRPATILYSIINSAAARRMGRGLPVERRNKLVGLGYLFDDRMTASE